MEVEEEEDDPLDLPDPEPKARHKYTQEQISVLERFYLRSQTVAGRGGIQKLYRAIQTSEADFDNVQAARVVQWFSNRRAKDRKQSRNRAARGEVHCGIVYKHSPKYQEQSI